VAGQRLPAVTLSLPVLFGLAVLLLVVGAGVVFAVMRSLNGQVPAIASVNATVTPTTTITPTASATPTETSTATPAATWTPPPPIEYKVAAGDTCGALVSIYNTSVNAIILANNLSADCILSEGMVLKIPQPTPTASPQPTSTLNATEQVRAECDTTEYIVKEGDSLSGISANYAVSMDSIRNFNALPSETVYSGQKIMIPLCEQSLETPTSTPVPPYPSPNLLLPADGASYANPSEVITLQWASVGALRQNESYAVTIEDVTEGDARKLVEYVSDTKFIVPESFRPTSNTAHVFRWSVLPVRQTGTDKTTGNPVWEPAGTVSVQRVFSWVGTGAPAPTNTPQP
jgi:LysM repeat protein